MHEGERFINKQGLGLTIVKYYSSDNIDVIFDDGFLYKGTSYRVVKSGKFVRQDVPYIYNKGYNTMAYQQKGNSLINSKCYDTWRGMLRRCYSDESLSKKPTYKDCKVCDEWLDYANFLEWYNNNYYTVGDQEMCLDKDILIKNNKLYSPVTCVFVPKKINSFFSRCKKQDKDIPIGVYMSGNKYISISCGEYLGSYDTATKAFDKYNEHRTQKAIKLCEEYSGLIPDILHKAIINYEYSIED